MYPFMLRLKSDTKAATTHYPKMPLTQVPQHPVSGLKCSYNPQILFTPNILKWLNNIWMIWNFNIYGVNSSTNNCLKNKLWSWILNHMISYTVPDVSSSISKPYKSSFPKDRPLSDLVSFTPMNSVNTLF